MKKPQTIYKSHGKVWCILISFLMFAQALSAQRTITGVVTDDRRETLPGVSIQIEGTSIGTVTDIQGRYSIVIPEDQANAVLLFSFIGMQTSRVPVGLSSTINVSLEEEATALQEVVITGFRTVSAEAYIGSAFVMSDASIRARPFGSVDEALRGNAPGLISTSSGQPGQAAEIRLRGVGSMNAGNQPLFVIDGVVWDMDDQIGDAGSPANPLTTLNPMDIANITILRDAASAALYGSRGANGVIVITTHSGIAADRPSISFMSQAGIGIMHMRPRLLNGPQFAELWTEAEMHRLILDEVGGDRIELAEQLWGLYLDKEQYLFNGMNFLQWQNRARHNFNNMFAIPRGDGTYNDFDFFGEHRHLLPNTSWFDEITRIAPFVQTDFSMRGGTRYLRYFLSLGYFNQQGTIIQSQLQRYSLRLRVSGGSYRTRLQWNLNNALTHSLQSGPPLSGANFNQPQYTASIVPPVVPVFLQDGSFNFNFPDNLLFSNNPVASARLNRNDRPQTRVFLQGYLQVNNILPGLRFRTTNTMNYNLARRTDYAHSDFGVGSAVGGRLLNRDSHNRRFTTTNLFTYDYNSGRHRLSAIAGAEFENRRNTFNQTIIGNFPTNNHHHASVGSEILGWSGGGSSYSQLGLIATVDYSYGFRYFITASFRRDGSSRFHPDHRWGNFWSVAGAWRISSEPWFRDVVPIRAISNVRLRMSYGESGTLPSEFFHWREVFALNTYMGATGARQTFIPSYDLSWEGNRIWNVGLDIRFFDDRIRFAAEYFDRRSHDLLRDVPVSMVSGFRTQLMNTSAGIHNTGFEFELGGTAFERGRHGLDINFNLATLRAVYYGLETGEWDPTMRQWLDNGLSVNSWRLRRWGGVDPQTGQRLIWRLDTDGTYGYGANRHAFAPWLLEGQGIPRVTGGLSLTYSWGPLSLSALFSYGWGHHIFDFLGASRTDTEGVFNNYSMSIDQLDRWTPLNPNGQVPMRLHGASPQTRHTRFLYRGDYLKIQSIRLQYTLPESFVNRIGMRSAIVFAQTENPWIFSHIPGYDPELSIDGFRMLDSFPSATTFLVGVSLNF